MSLYDDDDRRRPRRRRENLMDQRLRRSRGEEADEDYDDYDGGYDDDYEYAPRAPRYSRPPAPVATGGCAQNMLYALLAFMAIALLVVFFVSRTTNDVTGFFSGVAPSVQALMNTPTTTIRTDSAAVIQRVQQLNRLETTSFTVEKVIEAGVEGNPFYNMLYGDQLLLIAHGTVVAGVDLSQVKANDVSISVDGKTLTLQLPPAQILSASLDNEKTRVYRRDQGVLAENKDLETQARIAAQNEILTASCEDGILSKATEDSKQALQQLLGLADFETVIVNTQPAGQCAAPPSSTSATPTP